LEGQLVKAIGSANCLEAVRLAYQRLAQGADTLDAVVAGITLVEDDPAELTVGRGGLPNENGIVELDAAVMHGPTHRAGAVASLRNVRNPARLAQLVMEQTDHVLLAGEGALAFARAQGFQEENLLTERSRKIWLHWKRTLSERDDWLTPPPDRVDPAVAEFFATRYKRPTGTAHCAAIDAARDISATTSTSGLAFKLPGRVGDSPIVGAGLYVDNEVGSCGCTGRGEASIKNVASFAAVERMRGGTSPLEAGLAVLKQVVTRTTERHLLDSSGRPAFNLKLYLLAKDGTHAGVAIWGPAEMAVADERGARLEPCTSLFVREERVQPA
jgi:N4-(beta-N-acetylglucosaminyl)-L-asparaginase